MASGWAALSDGAGGHPGGGLAADLTVGAVRSSLEGVAPGSGGTARAATILQAATSDANDAVRARRVADASVAQMAATLTVALLVAVERGRSDWMVANVGDSRAWRVSAREAHLLTADDNLAGELLRTGRITPEEARAHPGRHRLTKAIGMAAGISARLTSTSLQPGEALVLCSDGLDVLGPDDLVCGWNDHGDPGGQAHRLVAAALAAGATDNITVVVLSHGRGTPIP